METNNIGFQNAIPVWLKEDAGEMNVRVIFQTRIHITPETELRLASSCVYNLYVDGVFTAYGPARAGRNVFRMDVIPLGKYAGEKARFITIEVQSYQVNSFYIMQQEPFVQAELVSGSAVLSYTGDQLFKAGRDDSLVQKVQRFTFQRPFIEAYRLKDDTRNYRTKGLKKATAIQTLSPRTIIERIAPYPGYERLQTRVYSEGKALRVEHPRYKDTRSYSGICDQLKGFKPEELEWHIAREVQEYAFREEKLSRQQRLEAGEYRIYELPYDAAGFPAFHVTAKEDSVLYVIFDEVLVDNDIDMPRDESCRAVKYELQTGVYPLKFFEVYCMKYIKFFVKSGCCEVDGVQLITYMHPEVSCVYANPNEDSKCIMDAAIRTFRSNAVDILMDCPSRERGGYPCDSFFTGRTEYLLTGKNPVEKSFLQNFLHEKTYRCIDEGMIPMCYPADHLDGVYIPNWALWLLLELDEYFERTGDRSLVEAYRDKAEGIIAFHKKLENAEYLLTHIPEGVFVEWSHANAMVQDINFPSNMLYYAALRKMAKLYGQPSYASHAEDVKRAILKYSYNGTFFCDHAKIEGETIRTINESSEICQYYAFCFGIAEQESFPELFERMVTDFSPKRHNNNKYPEICFAELFIGVPLRMEMLLKCGRFDDAHREILAYYLPCAKRTGTLWERRSMASCNHGFSSVVAYWLKEIEKRQVFQVLQ